MAARTHFLLLLITLAAWVPARASDVITSPVAGQSATVTQPHVTAELIPETIFVPAGKPFDLALHLHMDAGWHTYWINPGDAGLATAIKWTLPPGLTAGPIRWPTPEIHAMGPDTTYGYGGDVYLLTTITPDSSVDRQLASHFKITAAAIWLVCQEECIPGKAALTIDLRYAPDASSSSPPNEALFAAARSRLPVPNALWNVTASYHGNQFYLSLQPKGGSNAVLPGTLSFFAEQPNILNTGHPQLVPSPEKQDMRDKRNFTTGLAQNGEKPDHLSGVLVSDQPFAGTSKAIYLSSFPVSTTPASSPAQPAASTARVLPPVSSSVAHPFLLTVLGAAFLGGLILNLMPCVLPVLSLKVFSLIRHAGENSGTAWRQGVAFTVGVIISFWILAGLLLALRAAGHHLGWGFQMQSPGFVLALCYLFFLLGLNLFGVFELGSSLVGLDAKASSHLGGLTSSFANGALATLAATPCTAPFMGSSIGFAAQQPAAISLLIFTFLGLGMATPYLLLTTFPGALRLVPKPGAWMEGLRQFMGFLLMGTVIFLVYVFGALVGQNQIPALLGTLLFAGFAAWIFGRWSSPLHSTSSRTTAVVASLGILLFSIHWAMGLTTTSPASTAWQTYSPDALKKALAANHPVFVDFTAAWCLSCKVNEQVALDIPSTQHAFLQKGVVLLRGDWTNSDPEISKTLQHYNRDGVPLYLLYSPQNPDAPQVLPEVLTPGIVQAALQKM